MCATLTRHLERTIENRFFFSEVDRAFDRDGIRRELVSRMASAYDENGRLLQNISGYAVRCLYTSELLKEEPALFFDEKLNNCEDLDFVLRYLLRAEGAALTREALYIYAKNNSEQSTTQRYFPSLFEKLELFNSRLSDTLERFGFTEQQTAKLIRRRSVTHLLAECRNVCKRGSPYSFFARVKRIRALSRESGIDRSLKELYIEPESSLEEFLMNCFKRRREWLAVLYWTLYYIKNK